MVEVIMPGRFGVVVGVVIGAMLVAACSGPLAEGEVQFKRGRYARAKELLAALEPASRGWAGPARAEYALYRGLTCIALGDREHALPWLREARSIDDRQRGGLGGEDVRRLYVALEANTLP
jgi:hypothetical protein